MRKRKAVGTSTRMYDGTNSPKQNRGQETQIYHIRGKRPAARDGHTGNVFEDNLIIFGGDRHQMPFNDSYVFNLANET